MKIVVVFPTQTEARDFSNPAVVVEICGVGLSATAYQTYKIIERHRPDWLIMAGIAGVYRHSRFKIGDVVLVESECEADLGFFTVPGFTHLSDLQLDMNFTATKMWRCDHLFAQCPLPLAKSNSVNAAMAPFVDTAGIDIENMEGAAFFSVCRAERQRFLEVRSISNRVTIGDDNWDMDGALHALSKGINQVIAHLLSLSDC